MMMNRRKMGIAMGLTPFPSCKFKKALNNDVAIIELIRIR